MRREVVTVMRYSQVRDGPSPG